MSDAAQKDNASNVVVLRREDGRLLPGSNLHKLSKGKRAVKLSALIGKATNGGRELLELLLSIARDREHKDQYNAVKLLLHRYAGKEPDVIEAVGKFDNMTDAEIMQKLKEAFAEKSE